MRDWEREGLGWGCGRVGTWKAAGVGGCLLTQKAPLYLVSGVWVGGGLCLSSQSRWGEPVDRGKEEGDVCR